MRLVAAAAMLVAALSFGLHDAAMASAAFDTPPVGHAEHHGPPGLDHDAPDRPPGKAMPAAWMLGQSAIICIHEPIPCSAEAIALPVSVLSGNPPLGRRPGPEPHPPRATALT